MGSWTIQTTPAEDDAIAYGHQQSQRPMPGLAPPPGTPPPPVETVEAYFQRMTQQATLTPMVLTHQQAKNTELLKTLDTIPPENRPAARTEIESVIVTHGGAVKVREATYLWSDTLTPPPPDKTVTIDVSQADLTPVTKVFFDDQDNAGVSQRGGLLALTTETMVRIEDPNNAAHFLLLITTGAPVAGTGYVELPVRYHQSGGPLAAAWPMTCTFS
jgi:hypothetical protein